MTEEKPVRLFIAIELPKALKKDIGLLQKKLAVEGADGVKWVAPANIHLTLKFLGWVASGRLDAIKNAIGEAVKDIPPFELGIAGLGGFPNLRRLSVVWCGLTGDLGRLDRLHHSIEEHVSPLGFPTEKRAFSPHLTLARLRENTDQVIRQKLGEKLAATAYDPGMCILAESVSLMRSTLLPSGAVYSRLEEFPLNSTS